VTTERLVEFEGKHYVLQKREQVVEDSLLNQTRRTTQYSFDKGETWHLTMIDAYKQAESTGKLFRVGDDPGEGGEFESFVLSLVEEVRALRPGESLRLIRDQRNLVAVKEQAVFAVRASALGDVDLRLEDSSG
jgi:hypothetical protein